MQTLPPDESRKILDAMGIPVVVLRDRPNELETDLQVPAPESVSPAQKASALIEEIASRPSVATEIELPVAPIESVNNEANSVVEPEKSTPIKFSMVSAVSSDALLAFELPDWAGGLLEGRLTGICSDLVKTLSSDSQHVDWQYFHWPITGMKDEGESAAVEALDAWLHRRWGETESSTPVIAVSASKVDLSSIFSDALVLPPLGELAVSAEAKRKAWSAIQAYCVE